MTTIATLLATLVAWAAFGINTAIIVKVRSGVQSTIMGVSVGSPSFDFQWGAVMPLSLIAAVSPDARVSDANVLKDRLCCLSH